MSSKTGTIESFEVWHSSYGVYRKVHLLRVTNFLVFFLSFRFVQGRPRVLGNEEGHTNVRMDGACDVIQTWDRPNTNQEWCLLYR